MKLIKDLQQPNNFLASKTRFALEAPCVPSVFQMTQQQRFSTSTSRVAYSAEYKRQQVPLLHEEKLPRNYEVDFRQFCAVGVRVEPKPPVDFSMNTTVGAKGRVGIWLEGANATRGFSLERGNPGCARTYLM